MSQLFKWPSVNVALLALAVLQLSGCGSPESRARSYYEHGVQLAEQHDYARASIELRNAVRLKRDMLPAWRSLAQIEEATQAWGSLMQSLRAIADLDPSDLETRLKLGKLLLLGGSLDQAVKLADTVNEADRRNAGVLALKAAILYKRNDSAGAVQQAQEALEVEPGNADALVVLAAERMASGDAKGALRILESNRAPQSTDLGIQLFKLKIFEQLGDSRQFEALLRKLMELYPAAIGFRKQLVKFYIDQHRQDEAEKEIRTIVEANPADSASELDLVRFLLAVRGPAAARQELVARINAGGEVFPYQIALADFDFSQGNVTDSEQLLRNLVDHAGSSEQVVAAQTKLAEMYLNGNKTEAAEAVISEILRKDGRNSNGLKLRASVRMDRGELEPAIVDLRQALNDQPQSTELMLMLALSYERSGSIELAEKQYADALRASNFDPAVGLNYVGFLQRRGSGARAEAVLTELSTRSPMNLDILTALAQAKLNRQDWAGAQAIAESMRRAGDARGVADQILGAALTGRNKYDESIAVFQGAVDAAPNAVQPMVNLVRALVRAQRMDRATAFLQSTLRANPANAEAEVLLGTIQLASNAPDQALKSFKSAIEKQPKSVVGYQALASFYLAEKKFDEALEVVRSGLQEQPGSMVLHLALAGALEATRQYDAAIAEYEYILSQQPGSMIAANNLASLLSDHRDDKASLERAQSLAAVLRRSQVPQFKDTLGWVGYRRGDYKIAVSLLEEASAGMPGAAMVHYHLGMSYIAVNQAAKASEQLKTALSLAPDEELEEKIQDALKKLPS